MPDLLLPLKYAVAAVLAGAHTALTSLGLDPHAGLTWALAIAAVVAAVRSALLPFVVHGVRAGRAAALAAPRLAQLRARHVDRNDPAAVRALLAEQRAVRAEHGVPRWGCLSALLQLPLVFALYAVLSDVSAGRSVGAMDAALVASAGTASILGVRLADRVSALTAAPGQLEVVALLAAAAAGLSFATQRLFVLPNLATDGLPEQFLAAQRLMPAASAVGVLVAAWAVPAGLLVYWVAGNAWTMAQQAAIARWWPTPGSAAATRRTMPRSAR